MLGPVTQAMRLGSKTQPTASRTRAATSASAASSCTGSASCGVSGSCTHAGSAVPEVSAATVPMAAMAATVATAASAELTARRWQRRRRRQRRWRRHRWHRGLGGAGGFGGNGADGGNGGNGGNGGFGGINGTFGTNGAGGTGGLGTLLGGHNGNIGLNGATGGIGSTTLTNATVPLQLVNTTEPVVFISLNGGQMVPVLLDTGSTGLVMDSQFLTQNFGPVIGTGTAGYAGGLTYNYNTYSTTVDFGNGLLTLPTSVNVVTSSSPGTLGNFLSRSGAVGVLGIGPNNGFPGTSSIVTAMPGLLNNGVLIDESAGILQFGPNTLTGGITISGAPISTVAVQIDNGPLQQAPVMFDSGGINGTIPSALASLPSGGFVPAGTTISVYTSDGQTLLYSYTTTATNTPFVTSGGVMNTGHVPFAQQPIYVSYSPTAIGTTTFN